MYYTYILLSCDGKKTYTGSTSNILRRLEEHNLGKNKFTKSYRPFEIIHIEEFDTINKAIAMEKFYKSTSGRRKIKKFVENKRSIKS